MQKIYLLLPLILTFWLLGCGGGSSQNTPKVLGNNANFITAKDPLMHDIVKPFQTYTLTLKVNYTLEEDALSKDIISVYGTIDGANTKALLKLNHNYPTNAQIILEIYDAKDNLITTSKPTVIKDDIVNLGEISITK
jgi:hypothetical protein